MEEQSKFLEILEDMKTIARAQGNLLTRQEVQDYLGDMELSEEQWQAVCQYLGMCQIRIPGFEYVPSDPSEKNLESVTDAEADGTADEAAKIETDGAAKEAQEAETDGTAENLAKNQRKESSVRESKVPGICDSVQIHQRYHRDLQNLPSDRQGVPVAEIGKFLAGDQRYRDLIIESRLRQVVKIAEEYTKYSIPIEELIAEGNLGLLHGMARAEADRKELMLPDGTPNLQRFLKVLEQEVINAIEQLINQETESKGQEMAMLAKTNLLHESAKYLTEENGRIPTVQELSEYAKVSVEEIRQIMDLSEDASRVAQDR